MVADIALPYAAKAMALHPVAANWACCCDHLYLNNYSCGEACG